MRVGALGFWMQSLEGERRRRPSLDGDLDADVAIVGGGYTGLWTAYYLKRADPSLHVVVLERERVGFGASGRNGGWVSGFFSGAPRAYARRSEPASVVALQRAMFDTVDEVGRVLAEEAIDAELLKGGSLDVALGEAHAVRLRAAVERQRAWGVGPEDLRLLGATELAERVRIPGARCAAFSPHVARVHPAKLVTGLAAAVERLGVTICEGTPVGEIAPGRATTPRGSVRATEGYTASVAGLRRLLVPMNSSMIVTEPLAPQAWAQIGWDGFEAIRDGAHVYVYLQRTADGRIAIGGRGVPYRFGSRTDGDGATAPRTIEALRSKLARLFPAAAGVEIAHAWSGVIGVPRDRCVSIDADPAQGLAWAGGYVGQGVAAANLAGRTLRDLVAGERSELTRLPWVGHRPRRWEPEPLRWCAIRGVYALYRQADAIEARSGRPSGVGRLADAISGHR
jgi:glycine/D-amino acid oxidase-like deaminating enzyme